MVAGPLALALGTRVVLAGAGVLVIALTEAVLWCRRCASCAAVSPPRTPAVSGFTKVGPMGRSQFGLLAALGVDNFGSGLFLPVVLLDLTRVVGLPLALAGPRSRWARWPAGPCHQSQAAWRTGSGRAGW